MIYQGWVKCQKKAHFFKIFVADHVDVDFAIVVVVVVIVVVVFDVAAVTGSIQVGLVIDHSLGRYPRTI